MADIKYKIDDNGINEIFDEKGNTILALRKVQWGDSENSKLDMRKWYISVEKESPAKGFTFLTEDGPHNLVNILIKNGYGKTDEILDTIKNREDFKPALRKTVSKVKDIDTTDFDEEYYDPKEFLLQ